MLPWSGIGITHQTFIDTAQADSVNLTHICSLGLKQLLESDTVLSHLAGGHANTVGLESLSNCGMAQDIVGVRRF
jgi:hypothetical protein